MHTSYCFFFFLMIRRPPRSTLFPLHDALPISAIPRAHRENACVVWDVAQRQQHGAVGQHDAAAHAVPAREGRGVDLDRLRSEEHTSELQSQSNLVCRLLLEKKNKKKAEIVEHI